MEQWEREYVDARKNKINELLKEKEQLIEKLKEVSNKSEKYSIYWRLKEIFEQLNQKFQIIERWSRQGYRSEIEQYLCGEIYYFEKCLAMLKEKHGVEYVEFSHYLDAADLEYEYFVERNLRVPANFIEEDFISKFEGDTEDPKINIIINNIKNAQENLKLILRHKEREKNYKELFLFYEVLGDLFIHIYLILGNNRLISPLILKENLKWAYYYYLISLKNKEVVERANPRTGFDGLHRWPCFKIFVDFYTGIGIVNIHDVRLKIQYLERNYLKKEEILEIKLKLQEGYH